MLPHRFRKTWKLGFLLVAALILVFVASGVPQRWGRSVVFLLDIQPKSDSEGRVPVGFSLLEETLEIHPPSLTGKIYRPRLDSKTAGVVLIPGMHSRGIAEPRFERLARAVARQGFTVLAPDIADFRRFRISHESIVAIVQACRFLLEQRADVDARKVGIFGVSYAAGPALIAASRPEIADKIAFVVSVGGYYHLFNPIEYVLTGAYYMDGHEITLPPHPWARLIFALNNIDLIASERDVPALQKALQCHLEMDESEARAAEAALSPEATDLLALIRGAVTPELYERTAGARARVLEAAGPYSPAVVLTPQALQRMRARIYLLHGAKDDVIPCSETWQLAQALEERRYPARAVLISRGITHADSAGQSLDWFDKVSEGYKLVAFVKALLDER